MAKNINFVVLFNGTGNGDQDPAVTNVVKMRDGLLEDYVIYRDGIGNNKQWGWWLTKWIAELTGVGGGWVMNRAYKELINKLAKGIELKKIAPGDTLSFSVGGFSRGSAIARHFAIHYIKDKLVKDLKNRFNINLNVELKSEYLFDCVASFGLPFNIWALEKIGIRNQEIDPGWDFYIPEGTKVYHALAVDEVREPFTPKLIDYKEGLTEEVWFSGDHSSVGGGHSKPTPDTKMADENTLRYMVRRAIENGLRFKDEFLKSFQISSKKEMPLGVIQTPTWDTLPPTQRGPRDIYVQKRGKPSFARPIIEESVIKRMVQDKQYRPAALKKLSQFLVLKPEGEIEVYTPHRVKQLWAQLATPDNPKILRFSTRRRLESSNDEIAASGVEASRRRKSTAAKR